LSARLRCNGATQLAAYAQKWVNHLANDNNCQLDHTVDNKYGENLFGGSGVTPLSSPHRTGIGDAGSVDGRATQPLSQIPDQHNLMGQLEREEAAGSR
jgi:hypothetical protein